MVLVKMRVCDLEDKIICFSRACSQTQQPPPKKTKKTQKKNKTPPFQESVEVLKTRKVGNYSHNNLGN